MGKIITMDNFEEHTKKDPQSVGEFNAPTLYAHIQDAEGNDLGTVELEARTYKANQGKSSCGWFGAITNQDPVPFGKMPVVGQVTLRVRGLKLEDGDKVDIK